MKQESRYTSRSAAQTVRIGKKIASALQPGNNLFLYGQLGAGKTVLVKGIAQGLHIKAAITSPTFTVINQYDGRYRLFHIDLYRVKGSDIDGLGLDEYFFGNGIAAVEWAERLTDRMYENVWHIHINSSGLNKRIINVTKPAIACH
ncbi:MAG: tRNA (adenosine(37)-N6)-threonylcarbamoyltransferase complex ATPase subunit type 1 TsaE [Elusimicrobia bacterium]|nr:tRNA (adenosine(37)-N6)-threonylcarbamoyltransferase complex ATPase subunit type 1 TsaE [Elusimicrobiota bacterium]MBD3412220.1 tRNA (adenosine(37)-N6)-threonylcarbamoyltransferase complex ATPase subunit type 1 TsaE [Elusimicrobiota bacterium]